MKVLLFILFAFISVVIAANSAFALDTLRVDGVYSEFPFFIENGKILTEVLIVKFKEQIIPVILLMRIAGFLLIHQLEN